MKRQEQNGFCQGKLIMHKLSFTFHQFGQFRGVLVVAKTCVHAGVGKHPAPPSTTHTCNSSNVREKSGFASLFD